MPCCRSRTGCLLPSGLYRRPRLRTESAHRSGLAGSRVAARADDQVTAGRESFASGELTLP
jgi:hypothetical protein